MRSERKFDITELQWIALFVGLLVGVGITTLPRELVDEAGRDGWITILAGTVLALIYAKICLYYAKRFPEMTLAESIQLVLGKWIGRLVIVVYALYTLVLTGIVIRTFLEIIHIYFEVSAPTWSKGLIPLIVIVYMSRCGMATLARMAEIILMLTIPFFILMTFSFSEGDLVHILPIFEEGVRAPFMAVPVVSFAFLGIETIILVFYPYLEKKSTAHRVTYMGIAFICIFYLVVYLATLTVMGKEQVGLFIWPFVEILKIITVAIGERIDNVFLYFWAAKIIMLGSILYFAGTFSLATLTQKKYHDIWALACWPVIHATVIYPSTFVDLGEISGVVTKWSMGFTLTLPIILIIVAKIRGVTGEKSQNKKQNKKNKKAS